MERLHSTRSSVEIAQLLFSWIKPQGSTSQCSTWCDRMSLTVPAKELLSRSFGIIRNPSGSVSPLSVPFLVALCTAGTTLFITWRVLFVNFFGSGDYRIMALANRDPRVFNRLNASGYMAANAAIALRVGIPEPAIDWSATEDVNNDPFSAPVTIPFNVSHHKYRPLIAPDVSLATDQRLKAVSPIRSFDPTHLSTPGQPLVSAAVPMPIPNPRAVAPLVHMEQPPPSAPIAASPRPSAPGRGAVQVLSEAATDAILGPAPFGFAAAVLRHDSASG